MNPRFLVPLLLLGTGCQPNTAGQAVTDPAAPDSAGADTGTATAPAWTNRVWVDTDGGAVIGSMLVFLGDGTLLMDSCWETYRLARWQASSAESVTWNEDGATITADIAQPATTELALRLHLSNGITTRHYRTASTPFVCPDLPR